MKDRVRVMRPARQAWPPTARVATPQQAAELGLPSTRPETLGPVGAGVPGGHPGCDWGERHGLVI